MKKCRYLSFILILALLLTMLPVCTAAATKQVEIKGYGQANHIQQEDGSFMSQYIFPDGSQVHTMYGSIIQSSHKGYAEGDSVYKVTGIEGTTYFRHFHEFEYFVNRSGHGLRCVCGANHGFVAHDDPKNATDGKCHCGYEYYRNAQLTVIWMRNVTLSPRFSKDKYEYTGKLTADVDEISMVTIKQFDEKATLEAPASYKLQPGTNIFKFTVTAEDGKTTQTYTITIEK